jgi:hypothetical protein
VSDKPAYLDGDAMVAQTQKLAALVGALKLRLDWMTDPEQRIRAAKLIERTEAEIARFGLFAHRTLQVLEAALAEPGDGPKH